MKKYLLAILATGVATAADAGTATPTLTLNGFVVSSCTSALTTGTLSFIFVPGHTPTVANTQYNITCTYNTVISQVTAHQLMDGSL